MRILLLALLVAGCYRDSTKGSPPPANKQQAAEQVSNDVLALIPKESDIVVGADLAKLRSSPLWASQIEPLISNMGGNDLAKVRTTCGFDPLVAVSHVTFGTRNLGNDNEATAVARGIEPRGVIECVAKLAGSYEGLTRDGDTLVITEKGEPFQLAISPFGRSAVLGIGGRGANRAQATSRMQSGTPLRSSSGFMELYGKLEPGAAVWFIANGAAPSLQSLAGLGLSARYIDGTVTVTDRYVAAIRFTFKTPDEAQNLVKMVNQFGAQVRAMVETFEVHDQGPVARFDIVVTSAQAQTIMGMMGIAI